MTQINDKYDIIIAGGGPGGLTAGLYAARANRPALCIEKYLIGGQIANTHMVDDYPGFENVGGPELAEKMAEHAKKFGLEIVSDNITEIWSEGDDKYVATSSGITYKTKVVILSTGGSPNKLGVEGEDRLYGFGVSYCAICDGAFFKNQVIAVVGGGDAAVEEGLYLTKYGTKVYIIHRRDQLRAQKIIQDRAFANDKVEFVWDSVVESINGKDRVESVTVRNLKTNKKTDIAVGAVFPFIGFVPNSNLTREKLKTNENGYIITDDHMQTSVPGIFACGDVRSQLVRQITNAVGDGTTAAVAAERYLETLEDRARMSMQKANA